MANTVAESGLTATAANRLSAVAVYLSCHSAAPVAGLQARSTASAPLVRLFIWPATNTAEPSGLAATCALMPPLSTS